MKSFLAEFDVREKSPVIIGIVLAAASFAALGLLGAGLVVVPFMVVLARRSAVAAAP